METSTKHHTIQVKSKFASQLKYLATVDTLLSSVQLYQIEDGNAEDNNSYIHFRVKFKDEISSKYSITELQDYVNSVCDELEAHSKQKSIENDGQIFVACPSGTGEDSSYDSDYEGSEEQSHQHDDISRTVSDTLGQEFSEYISTSQPKQQPSDFAYQSKLEFALKLGYTEKLVQAALYKLGPNPEQNELLAELIKLGAHQQSCMKFKNDSNGCDNVDEFPEQIAQGNSDRNKLRPIVIDGSNVAMSHGNKEVFSCRGIKICVDWFRLRGHSEITVFVPKWRKETPHLENFIIDQEILYELERERLLVFTPSREVGGKRMVCYDDRYILKLAADNEGVVVSNDNYRDLTQECPEFRKVIEERILMYSFVNDRFMPPDDPLGRTGPTLEIFLKMPTFRKGETCPYSKKCTYGNKCKYNHPERGLGPQKSVTERLVENAQKQLLARSLDSTANKKVRGKSLSLPLQSSTSDEGGHLVTNQAPNYRKETLSRTKSTTFDMAKNACNMKGDKSPTYSMGSPSAAHMASAPYNHMLHQRNNLSTSQATNFNMENNPSAVNLHRKLQRELSINPTFDPRIYQLQKCYTSSETPHHIPASRHYSFQDHNYLSAQHPNVTRISSAPPANPSHIVSNECAHNSSSEPQLSASSPMRSGGVPTAFSPVSSSLWSVHPQWPASANYSLVSPNVEETRRKLHFHLASIFPEEQVDAAMRYCPNETNPQKICAAILSMFSPKP